MNILQKRVHGVLAVTAHVVIVQGGNSPKWDYLLEGRPFVAQASPAG